MHSRHLIILSNRLPNPELVQRGHGGTIQVWFIRVRVAVHGRVDGPFDEFQRGVEARWKAVADGSVEVMAEDQVVAVDGFLEDNGKGNGVLVVSVEGVREVGVCFGRVVGVALFPDREPLFPKAPRRDGGGDCSCSPVKFWIRTQRLTVARPLSIRSVWSLLTGTILWLSGLYSAPAVTLSRYL